MVSGADFPGLVFADNSGVRRIRNPFVVLPEPAESSPVSPASTDGLTHPLRATVRHLGTVASCQITFPISALPVRTGSCSVQELVKE